MQCRARCFRSSRYRFVRFALSDECFARMLEEVTGLPCEGVEPRNIGERVWDLERRHDLTVGVDPGEDTLPPRLPREPASEGPAEGKYGPPA